MLAERAGLHTLFLFVGQRQPCYQSFVPVLIPVTQGADLPQLVHSTSDPA